MATDSSKKTAKKKASSKTKKKTAAKRKQTTAAKKKAASKRKSTAKKPASKRTSVKLEEIGEQISDIELEEPEQEKQPQKRAVPSVSVSSDAVSGGATSGVRERDITVFLRQLLMMLESGTPVLKALKTLSRRGETKGIRTLVTGIAEYVESGNPMWQAFAREPKHFSPVDVNLIKAAEASGTLPQVLARIADTREQRERLRRFMQVAMIYPSILVAVSLALIIILSVFVIPAFREIFTQMDAELNWYSEFIMTAADVIAGYWWVFVLLLIGAITGYQFWVRQSPIARLRADQWKLKLPIAGNIVEKRSVAEFMRTFAMLQRSGISMMATLDLCKNSVGNHAYIGVIQDMRDSVESGEGLEAPLREAERNGYMSGVVVDMMLTGEETGSMEQVADQVAGTYEEEVEIAVNGLKEAITPVFVVLMGFIVGGIVLGMFLPLISMIDSIAGGTM